MAARHWLLVSLPIVALGAAVAIAIASVQRMANEVNAIEARLTERSVGAAIDALLRRTGLTHGEYAVWDDAVRNLYGAPDAAFVEENYAASTLSGTFFDTAYLVEDDGRMVLGLHDGRPSAITPDVAFGTIIHTLRQQVTRDAPSYSVATGLLRTVWGVQAVAIGPVVPNTDQVAQPGRLRYLVISRTIGDEAIARLSEDYLIQGLRIGRSPATTGVALRDPTDSVIAWLGWEPAAAGTAALRSIDAGLILAFGLVGLGVFGVSLLAVGSIRRSETLAGDLALKHERLEGALTSVPNGVCIFDADKRLLMCNARYAEMYQLPSQLTEPGTRLSDIFEYRRSIGNAPTNAPSYVSHLDIDWTTGGTKVFEFQLEDGRTVRISHLNMEGGSYIATHVDISDALAAERRLAEIARSDVLTGLPNRTAFREVIDTLVGEPDEHRSLAVLSVDLDRFKDINDSLGHLKGDTILAMAADRLRAVGGVEDRIARMGGDSFGIVQAGAFQPDGARSLAKAVCTTLNRPFVIDGVEVRVGASIGVALAPGHGNSASDLVRNSETALYWTKDHGRNAFEFFDPAMNSEAHAHHRILAGLRSALERNEFTIHYQPFVDLKSGATIGFEALLRWRHPELGDVSPLDFIPIAEESGLIVEIGEWVLRTACLEAARWPYPLYVAVNLSSTQFRDEHLGTVVFKALAAAGLAATRLELEVTETVLLADEERVRATLHHLRSAGIRIVMDDFGTGYSSLSYLRSFPFDKLKIDQSFIRDLPESQEAAAIVRAVIGLGSEFGLMIVAEGVETAAQGQFLLDAGCQEAQGFHFGAPQPAAAVPSQAAA